MSLSLWKPYYTWGMLWHNLVATTEVLQKLLNCVCTTSYRLATFFHNLCSFVGSSFFQSLSNLLVLDSVCDVMLCVSLVLGFGCDVMLRVFSAAGLQRWDWRIVIYWPATTFAWCLRLSFQVFVSRLKMMYGVHALSWATFQPCGRTTEGGI
jgi:hypothetical protein